MDIEPRKVRVADLYEGYVNDAAREMGVTGYDDELNIRPPYQRNYVYEPKERDEVVRTVRKGFPLSVFYWVDLGEDRDDQDAPRYEVLDGQQRTISICEYVDGNFAVDGFHFDALTVDEQRQIEDYELLVYVCRGDDREKLDWFETINIAGKPLRPQELLNAIYSGTWVSAAKGYFSRTGGPATAYMKGEGGGMYLTGDANRQDFLETVIGWHASVTGETVRDYMSRHKHDADAAELRSYFESVIDWAHATFRTYRSTMKGVEWGLLYNDHHGRTDLDVDELERRVSELTADREVKRKAGVYEYLLTGDERTLNLRQFSDDERQTMYERQGGVCPKCRKRFDLSEMHGDHIVPWSKGGKTVVRDVGDPLLYCNTQNGNNGQMLCGLCNERKGAKG